MAANPPPSTQPPELSSNNISYYRPSPGTKLNASTRELLEEYSHIPPEDVERHVLEMRDRAWEIFPYPCIGSFRFLDLYISQHPLYAQILTHLKSNSEATLLDLGCCFGQEIRRLVHDGVPSSQLYACDLRPEYWMLGQELFRDGGRLRSGFVEGDVFADEDDDGDEDDADDEMLGKGGMMRLKDLNGKMDIIWAASFLHLFSWADQVLVCKRIISLLKPVQGAMVLGRQTSALVAGEREGRWSGRGKVWRHSADSFKRLWQEVGELTGTTWSVEVQMLDLGEDRGSDDDDDGKRRMVFSVVRD